MSSYIGTLQGGLLHPRSWQASLLVPMEFMEREWNEQSEPLLGGELLIPLPYIFSGKTLSHLLHFPHLLRRGHVSSEAWREEGSD